MHTTKRRRHTSVIQRLLDEPHRFELVQTVRILELWFRKNGLAPDQALRRFVRYRNSLSMNFPASQVETMVTAANGAIATDQALQAALVANQLKHIQITPAYMGFLGVSGAMPYRFTEDIAAQVQIDKYEGGRAYFDIFSNRILALHYQAWGKYRIRYRYDAAGKDTLLPIQLALAGGRPPPSRAAVPGGVHEGVCDEVVAHYAALLRQRPTSAKFIAGVLAEYFGVPVRLEQFSGKWDMLGEKERSKLGRQNCTLGQGATLGPRCWNRNAGVRIHIGPLSRADFEQFLPGGSANKALRAMLSLFSTHTIEFDMNLILRAADVCAVTFGARHGTRLGMGAVLATKPAAVDHGQLFALRL